MENVWEATRLVCIIYAIAAVVSFLVTLIITFTFAAVRMHGAPETKAGPSRVKEPPASPKAPPEKGA